MDSWERHVLLAKSEFAKQRLLHLRKPALVGVVPPVVASPKKAAILTSHNVEYHLNLGLSMMYVYVNKALYRAYMDNPVLSKLHSKKKIAIVVWQDVHECSSHLKCNKVFVWSYTLLGLWGTGYHVLLTDVDEFLALRPPLTVADFMTKCVGNASEARFTRFNILCDDCTGEFDEFAMWTAQGSNPLTHYSSVTGHEAVSAGKSVVNAEFVHGYAQHAGSLLGGGFRVVHENCSRILHLPNMFRTRIPYGTYNESFTEWQWVLR